MYKLISEINWDPVVNEKDVNKATEHLYNALYQCFDSCVPKKHRSTKNYERYPTWYTKEIIHDLKLKSHIHKIWKQDKDQYVYSFFKAIRADIKLRSVAAYQKHTEHIETHLS